MVVDQLRAWRIVLASQSPRRLQLLKQLGLPFDVIPSTFEENLDKSLFPTPDLYVMENAKQKALEVFNRLKNQGEHPEMVIGCDTVVSYRDKILEKPKDEQDAFNMLSMLSNNEHQVFSGVALCVRSNPDVHVFSEKTAVQFRALDPQTIRGYTQHYIATGEPMDKAGSYGLQGQAKAFVTAVHGCSNNVIGFPVDRFCKEVERFLTS
ncbi:unnamed protein product [Aphanomyces euteiches]